MIFFIIQKTVAEAIRVLLFLYR